MGFHKLYVGLTHVLQDHTIHITLEFVSVALNIRTHV